MKVLVIDHQPQYRRALRAALEKHSYEVLVAETSDDGLTVASIFLPDLILIDISLPCLSGYEVCKELRRWSKVPIIILSALDREESKVKALDLGADDYLTKPFGMGELLARIRAVVRRSKKQAKVKPIFKCANLSIDFSCRTVRLDDKDIRLTPKEYDLLTYMSQNANRIVTHRMLLLHVWGPEYVEDTHTLFVHMANLRKKIEANRDLHKFIRTEKRIGYRFINAGQEFALLDQTFESKIQR